MVGGYEVGSLSKLNPFQAALRWVLDDKNIDTAIPSVTSMEQVDQNFEVMGSKLTFSDRKTLSRYAGEIASMHCSSCGSCGRGCTHGVQCSDILRFLMYAEGISRDGSRKRELFGTPCRSKGISLHLLQQNA